MGEFRRALKNTAPTSGTLIIYNHMGRDQYIIVNGEQHLVLADASLKLQVSVGTVSTRLPNQKSVNWTVGAPEYQQAIRIHPETTPSNSVRWTNSAPLTLDPIYIDPWGLHTYIVYP
jgi:hypothetical protein